MLGIGEIIHLGSVRLGTRADDRVVTPRFCERDLMPGYRLRLESSRLLTK